MVSDKNIPPDIRTSGGIIYLFRFLNNVALIFISFPLRVTKFLMFSLCLMKIRIEINPIIINRVISDRINAICNGAIVIMENVPATT